jgi:hypothetical protein
MTDHDGVMGWTNTPHLQEKSSPRKEKKTPIHTAIAGSDDRGAI